MTPAEILLASPRITHRTLGYLAPLLDTDDLTVREDTEALLPLREVSLLICNCPSYSSQHRH